MQADYFGPVLRKRLLEEFGSLRAIEGAGPDALARVRGVSPALAERIHGYLAALDRP